MVKAFGGYDVDLELDRLTVHPDVPNLEWDVDCDLEAFDFVPETKIVDALGYMVVS